MARAVGIEAAWRRAPQDPQELRRALFDPNPAVQGAALRAARRLQPSEASALLPVVRVSLQLPWREVACEAARTLSSWGDASAYHLVTGGARAAEVLGTHAAEVLVDHGEVADLERLQQVLSRFPPSGEHLFLVARFGHPAAWGYLLHHLGNADLADDAAEALATLFGPRVDEDAQTDVGAWRAAIEALAPEPDVRLTRGQPWTPRLLAEELAAGDLTPAHASQLSSELSSRCNLHAPLDLAAWSAEEAAARASLAASTNQVSARYPAGRWAISP
ncbi:MAG: hypothetical protein WKG00_23675 [Polyangiaceae bacterium]